MDIHPKNDLKKLTPYPTQKLVLEIGIGNGEHLEYLARQNPQTTFIGTELSKLYAEKAARRVQISGMKNAHVFYTETIRFLTEDVRNHCFDKIFIICPDPWPKKKHLKHRITYIQNLKILLKKLKPTGRIWLLTDNPVLAETTLESVKALDISYKTNTYTDLPISIFRTKYIRKWEKTGSRFYSFEIKNS